MLRACARPMVTFGYWWAPTNLVNCESLASLYLTVCLPDRIGPDHRPPRHASWTDEIIWVSFYFRLWVSLPGSKLSNSSRRSLKTVDIENLQWKRKLGASFLISNAEDLNLANL